MRRSLSLYAALSAAGLVLVIRAPVAFAADEIDEEQVAAYAVQSRVFRLGGELDLGGGILPLNAFAKGLTVGGAFTYHMSNTWGWEIVRGIYVAKQLDTGLKKELLENFDVQPTEIATIDFILSSNLVLKPFYGKLALFNRRVIHIEVAVPFGVAVSRYSNPTTYLPGPNAGLLFRVFVSPHVSLRLDVRDYVFFNGWSTRNELHVGLGAAFAWGGDER